MVKCSVENVHILFIYCFSIGFAFQIPECSSPGIQAGESPPRWQPLRRVWKKLRNGKIP
jgi:hypothetical protein